MQTKRNAHARRRGFRSEGETQIAGLLDRFGIPYLYEHPAAVVDDGRLRIWYPDFLLPRQGIHIEYAGIQGNADYSAAVLKKEAVYRANGMDTLIWTPDRFKGYWPEAFLEGVENILLERVRLFQSARARRGASPASLPVDRG